MEPSRPPNPNPSSLLWAHQIRREHIHLVQQIDILKADIAVATETMNDLKRDLEKVTRQVEDTKICNALVKGDLVLLECRLDTRLHTMLERINSLEKENGLLKTRVEVLEAERQRGGEHHQREAPSTVSQRQGQKRSPGRQPTVLRIACENGVFKRAQSRGLLDQDQSISVDTTASKPLTDSEILAPDSMPANESSPLPLLCPEDYVRSLSETTLTSSYISKDGEPQNNRPQTRSANTNSNPEETGRWDQLTKEKRSRLADFYHRVSPLYMGWPHPDNEERNLSAFVRSIHDTDTRVLLEARMHVANCRSWDELRAMVHEMTEESEGDAAVGERVIQPGADVQQATARNGNPVKSTLKRKRYIPIVPPDQEEQLVIDSYGRGLPGVS
ncbi:hypothetical protein N8T08_010284 [Aspergillus melleus]|uniref:Uncharacterized protein n=1 Tax=Aspergillus melleus TaxID=138277 RepID=A0ACC3AT78_9EURO|nr:hypothetical protein N8T08_010284 [Aspergillus melleus]